MRNSAPPENFAPLFSKIPNMDEMIQPLRNTRWQTWLVTVQAQEKKEDGFLVDIISLEENKTRIVKQIYSPATAAHKSLHNKTAICTATYADSDLFTCLPGQYAPHSPAVQGSDDEHTLSSLEKLSAFLEESLWKNLFQRLVIISSPQNRKAIRSALSIPAQARIVAFYDIDE